MTTIRSRAAVGAALAQSHPLDRAVFRALQHCIAHKTAGVTAADVAMPLLPHLAYPAVCRALGRLERLGIVRHRAGCFSPVVKAAAQRSALVPSCAFGGHYCG